MNCQISQEIFDVLRLLQEDRKYPREYGTGISLHYTEMAFLDVVAQNPNANVSRISELLGITKSAVTQTCTKLAQKELIAAMRREDNKKEKYFRLTPLGEQTRAGQLLMHQDANRQLCNYFSALSPQEGQVVFKFLQQLKDCIPFCNFTCNCSQENYTTEVTHNERDTTEHSGPACCSRIG